MFIVNSLAKKKKMCFLNANKNHNEVRFHTSQNGCDPKVERVWRKGNPLTLLVGMQTSTATMENSVESP